METITDVLRLVVGTAIISVLTYIIKYIRSKTHSSNLDVEIKSQEQMFEWALKVVKTIEEEYRDSDLEKKVKSQRKFDQALSRLNDIVMLNGIDPRSYNTPGIITYSVYVIHTKGGD